MAKISTYATEVFPQLTDKIIGTSTIGTPDDETVNFTVADLLSLYVSNVGLQEVLDTNNTAIQDINLSGAISTTDLSATNDIYVAGSSVRVGKGEGTGLRNTVLGTQCLYINTTGYNNTAVGDYSLQNNVTGLSNTSIGMSAMILNNAGKENVAIGELALSKNTIGGANVVIGYNACDTNVEGENNVVIGHNADVISDKDNNQIVIGAGAVSAGSNTVVIGNTSIVKTILRGTVNMNNLPTSAAGLVSGDLWKNGSVVNIV